APSASSPANSSPRSRRSWRGQGRAGSRGLIASQDHRPAAAGDPSPEKTDETNPRLICFFDLSQTAWERLTAATTANYVAGRSMVANAAASEASSAVHPLPAVGRGSVRADAPHLRPHRFLVRPNRGEGSTPRTRAAPSPCCQTASPSNV